MSGDIPESARGALIAAAHRLADAAAVHTLPHFRSAALASDNKDNQGGFDPVTLADREAEAAIRALLEAERPEDGIYGEEEDPVPGSSGLTWVIDPIDGTRAFISGLPTWGTLIALDAGEGPVLGLIDQPYIGERFFGGFGTAEMTGPDGARRPLRTRACGGLAEATLYTTYPEVGSPAECAGFEAVARRVNLTRYGVDCYAYALLAMGHVDLVIEAGLQPYDIQGPMAVIAAAGGVVTDWQGGPAHMGGRIVAAGDRRVHAAALEILGAVPQASDD